MAEKSAAHIFIEGKVQGVGFRNFVQRYAYLLSLKGVVKNVANGQVEVEVEGDRVKIDLLLEHLHRGPALAKVEKINLSWSSPSGKFHDFSIIL